MVALLGLTMMAMAPIMGIGGVVMHCASTGASPSPSW